MAGGNRLKGGDIELKSGEVVVDRFHSHLHRGVARLLPEALAHINSRGRSFLVDEVVFDHVIGETICVPTGPGDRIVYAKRSKRFGLTRFVKNREPKPSSSVTIVLKAAEEDSGTYVLIFAFIGGKSEPEPWDKNAMEKSVAFWGSHALVWGCEPVVPGTETTVCPW
jgi:hypothetical protein